MEPRYVYFAIITILIKEIEAKIKWKDKLSNLKKHLEGKLVFESVDSCKDYPGWKIASFSDQIDASNLDAAKKTLELIHENNFPGSYIKIYIDHFLIIYNLLFACFYYTLKNCDKLF